MTHWGKSPQFIQKFTLWKSQFVQNSHPKNDIFHKIHNFKIIFFTKFTFSKSQFSQNSHSENHIFDKIHNFKIPYFTKLTFSKSHFSQNSHFSKIKYWWISGLKTRILLQCDVTQRNVHNLLVSLNLYYVLLIV